MLSQNKTVTYVIGGVALASLALLTYTITRPSKKNKRKSGKKKKKEKSSKFTCTFKRKPIDIHLVMANMESFNAHVAADKKNAKLNLKYGSRLVKINDNRVEDMAYEDIFAMLSKTKVPVALTFKEFPEMEKQWLRAENLKEAANNDYKAKKVRDAIEKVSTAIDLHPTNKILYSNRILMLIHCNEYDLALRDCQMIRELDPKSVYIKGHYLRGLVLLNLKKYKNAASAFQTVVKLNPQFKKATDRLNECLKELDKENIIHETRKSLEHEELKKTLKSFEVNNDQNNDKNDNDHDGKNENDGGDGDGDDDNNSEKKDASNEVVIDNNNNNDNDNNDNKASIFEENNDDNDDNDDADADADADGGDGIGNEDVGNEVDDDVNEVANDIAYDDNVIDEKEKEQEKEKEKEKEIANSIESEDGDKNEDTVFVDKAPEKVEESDIVAVDETN